MPNHSHIAPLPQKLRENYVRWKTQKQPENAAEYERLAKQGQSPSTMVISCCDARVHATEIFNAAPGDFFVHRNIANLVPPYKQNSDFHGTSSAVEYAVKILRVQHLIVLGHAHCGGVQACHNMCRDGVSAEQADFEFVGHWLEMMRPAFAQVDANTSDETQFVAMNHAAIKASLDNLLGFPFVADAIEAGKLHLHGAWFNIANGDLLVLNPVSKAFESISD